VLIGNTKHVWEPFLKACAFHRELIECDDPFDSYVETAILSVLENLPR
jgi:hypothetical protein